MLKIISQKLFNLSVFSKCGLIISKKNHSLKIPLLLSFALSNAECKSELLDKMKQQVIGR